MAEVLPRAAPIHHCCGRDRAGDDRHAPRPPVGTAPSVSTPGGGPPVAEAPLRSGNGYWSVDASGQVTAHGQAPTLGDLAARSLNAPIVGMAATADGHGYWLVASDGGVFAFGDATFHGSTGALHLNAPVVGIAATPTGAGYWLVASDGGIFAFGDATFHGSAVGSLGGRAALGIIPAGDGYWVTGSTGQVLSFGGAPTIAAPPIAVTVVAAGGDPRSNVTPGAAFAQACYSASPSAACDAQALTLIDTGRAAEGLGPLQLPSGYANLDAVDQLVAVTNAERTSRGLPAMSGLSGPLDGLAAAGAQAVADPSGPAGTTWTSNMAWGLATPLAADFEWMYDDGLGSNNVDCATAESAGCWGHRHNILVPWGGTMGTAALSAGGGLVMTELLTKG